MNSTHEDIFRRDDFQTNKPVTKKISIQFTITLIFTP